MSHASRAHRTSSSTRGVDALRVADWTEPTKKSLPGQSTPRSIKVKSIAQPASEVLLKLSEYDIPPSLPPIVSSARSFPSLGCCSSMSLSRGTKAHRNAACGSSHPPALLSGHRIPQSAPPKSFHDRFLQDHCHYPALVTYRRDEMRSHKKPAGGSK